MKRFIVSGFVALCGSVLCAHAEFRAGAAQVIITPPDGVNLAGYYNFRGSDGVLDDIHSRALVMDDGKTRAALVTLDLIGTPREMVEADLKVMRDAPIGKRD